ncbi:MAG: hypothetical protein AMS26_08510 [Bacteroides sp. SM23_62]|nr:MAG: hypothetical protein AMS26_08510 [Bacteroides sp. SM23_62]
MQHNKQKTSQGEVWMDKDGILYQDYAPGTELKHEDSLKEVRVYRTYFCKEVKRSIVVDITNIKRVSKESRDIYSSEEMGGLISAAALIVGNPVSRIMGNFYMGINKTKMPVRMFTSTGDARKWLKDFLP